MKMKQKIILIIVFLAIVAGIFAWYQYGRHHPIKAQPVQAQEESGEPAVSLPPVENIKAGVMELDSETYHPLP